MWTTTGDVPNADASSQAVIVLYGENGCSDEIPLGLDLPEKFKKGETDQFDVSRVCIYMISKFLIIN